MVRLLPNRLSPFFFTGTGAYAVDRSGSHWQGTDLSYPYPYASRSDPSLRIRLRIAIFDYKIIPNNPIGSCHLAMLRALAEEHEFTVFAVQFSNPHPERIRFVRVPCPTRPLALLFVAYHLVAPLCYLRYRLSGGRKFDLIQTVESNSAFGDVFYAHFCHGGYLKHHWKRSGARGLRGWFRWLDHTLHAWVEKFVYPRAAHIVVPSRGLSQELKEQFPSASSKVTVLSNPINVGRLQAPPDFDRAGFRHQLGLGEQDLAGLFVALGQFERKGLPMILDALAEPGMEQVKLVVVGGESDLIARYREETEKRGVAERVKFVGMQSDVRPYLWSSDVFVFPSLYETFSLVTYEAAASGLPIVASHLYGVEDLLRDGENGFLVETTAQSVRQGLQAVLALTPAERAAMGRRAREAASSCSVENFVEAWRAFYRNVTPQGN
jgi:glycosyltransferase involved in cell wall biosynthesis